MVDHAQILKALKGYIANIVAVTLIGIFVYLLVKSAFDKNIQVPAILISLGSGAVGYYLTNINKNKRL